jgi:hypothetical protein
LKEFPRWLIKLRAEMRAAGSDKGEEAMPRAERGNR